MNQVLPEEGLKQTNKIQITLKCHNDQDEKEICKKNLRLVVPEEKKLKIQIKLKNHESEQDIEEPILHGLAITITYSECVENHVKMQQLGQISDQGFTLDDLMAAKEQFEKVGVNCQLHYLNEALSLTDRETTIADDAYVLIVRNAVDALLKDCDQNKQTMMSELTSFAWDTQALMRKKVVNKHARHNVCFSEVDQEPDIPNGQGTVISFERVACPNWIRSKLPQFLGNKAEQLLAEGNKYNDVAVNGIGAHGDTERKKVIGVRLGQSFPLHYQWFLRFKPVGERIKLMLHDGDMYVMSQKAVGHDWKKSSLLTLRHAAGANKYLIMKSNE